MRHLLPFLLFLGVASTSAALADETLTTPTLLVEGTLDVGAVYPFSEVSATAKLVNAGSKPVSISKVAPRLRSGAPKIEVEDLELAPGQSTSARIVFEAPERAGGMSRVFDVYSKDTDQRIASIVIRGFVDWIVDPDSLNSDIGIWHVREPFAKTLHYESRPGTDVRLKKILAQARHFDVSIVENGNALQIQGKKAAPWGLIDEEIAVETSNPDQKKIVFRIRGEARGSVVPSVYMVAFDPVREGEAPERIVKLIDEAGQKLNLGEVSVDGTEASVSVGDCFPVEDICKQVVVRLPPQKLGSPPRGVIKVALPDYKMTLPIFYGGTVIGKNTQIRDLREELEKAKDAPVSLSAMLKNTISELPPLEMPAPEGTGPLITWQVSNETSVYGYEIYRAATESGKFGRINENIIRRLDAAERQTSVYKWRDQSVISGNEYWYYIEIVYVTGEKKALTSPQRVIAK